MFFVLCLFRDRLPTKDNLLHHGVIDNDSQLCVGGWGSLETSSHLFLHCCYFGPVWHFIHCWLGVSSVLPVCVADQFSYVGSGGSKGRQSIIQLIW